MFAALSILCSFAFITLVLRYFLIIITVSGSSMEPTLTSGDRILALCHWPRRLLQKQQIVLVQQEIIDFDRQQKARSYRKTNLSIKRLIGVPNDTVVITKREWDNAMVASAPMYGLPQEDDHGDLCWILSADQGFVKGDNKQSVDSVLQGPIPLRNVTGIMLWKLPKRAVHLNESPVEEVDSETLQSLFADGATSISTVNDSTLKNGKHSYRTAESQQIPWRVIRRQAAEQEDIVPYYPTEEFSDREQIPPHPGPGLERGVPVYGNMRSPYGQDWVEEDDPTLPFGLQFIRTILHILGMVWQAYPVAFIGVILITILQGLLPLANAWIIKVLFDWLALRLTGAANMRSSELIWLLTAQAAISVATMLLPSIHQYLNSELGRRLTLSIERTIYQKINSLRGIAHFENPQVYDTIRLAQHGADMSSGQTLQILMQGVQSLVTLLSFISVLFSFQLTLAALVFLSALPQLIAQLRLGQQRFDLTFDVSPDNRRKFYYEYLLAGVEAAKEVRLFGLENYLLEKLLTLYQRIHHAERAVEQRELRWETALGLLTSAVSTIAFILIVWSAFEGQLTLGDITLYIAAVAMVQTAINGLVSGFAGLNESVLFHSYFQNLLTLTPVLPVKVDPLPVPPLADKIELHNVSFRYHDSQSWILRNVNLTIEAGSCLALVGLNGTGKTTLVKLLTRLYDPTEGEIRWNGKDLREFNPDELRQHIGAIFQDFMHYDLSVRENIGLGNLGKIHDIQHIQAAAKLANIHDDITKLPQGYETELSRMFAEEGQGFDLSGGQWQKIATARMFAREADLLILDEPTAALDAQAEYEVYRHFTKLMAERTSILISHRFSTVRMADKIAVLEDGHITEYGTHDELIAAAGSYARLYQMQAESYLPTPVQAAAGQATLAEEPA